MFNIQSSKQKMAVHKKFNNGIRNNALGRGLDALISTEGVRNQRHRHHPAYHPATDFGKPIPDYCGRKTMESVTAGWTHGNTCLHPHHQR